jgi:hypothetical protein
MNKIIFYFLLAVMGFNQANAETLPPSDQKQVAMSVHDVFFPSELKSTEPVNFVVNGMFPNTCYSMHSIDVKHVADFRHEVRVYANVKHAICAMVLMPYTQEGSLGLVKSGRHMVLFLASDGTGFEKVISVK